MTPIWLAPMHMILLPSQLRPLSKSETSRIWFDGLTSSTPPMVVLCFAETALGTINVVVTVSLSLVVTGLPGKASAGIFSMGIMCTGADAATMETLGFATGPAKEELMQKRARITALIICGLWNRDILLKWPADSS